VLFNKHDIYNFVEAERARLKKAYDALPDDKALDESVVKDLKQQFMLNIPILKPEKWEAEERPGETAVYVPFEGDPAVFEIAPSAFNGTVAVGEIVGSDLVITVSSPLAVFDIEAHVKREIAKVEWRLYHLRGSMEHMSQQLEIGLRESMMVRRRVIENKEKARQTLTIPRRQPPPSPAPVESKPVATAKPKAPELSVQEIWDIFMSHASPDKPYVRGLVKALRSKGVSVWFDEDCIKPGEPSRQAIKNGLRKSTYGIVVLSPAYIADRKWTEHEFDALFARERLNSFIIMPVWHGVTRDEIEEYDPALADRNSISKTDDYDEIAQNVLKLLGRVPHEDVSQPAQAPASPPARTFKPDELELVAYIWYYTKDGKSAQMYVRKVRDEADLFVLEEPNGPVHTGTREEIADKYSSTDRRLLGGGLTHHIRNSSSAYSDFNIGG